MSSSGEVIAGEWAAAGGGVEVIESAPVNAVGNHVRMPGRGMQQRSGGILNVAHGSDQIARITPTDPNAVLRAAQLREIAKLFD